MVKCFYCNHDCHCNKEEHTDEYSDICTYENCNCKNKDEDKTWENEVVYEK